LEEREKKRSGLKIGVATSYSSKIWAVITTVTRPIAKKDLAVQENRIVRRYVTVCGYVRGSIFEKFSFNAMQA
jgi:hypothetical protein